jgi:hypothetical protein
MPTQQRVLALCSTVLRPRAGVKQEAGSGVAKGRQESAIYCTPLRVTICDPRVNVDSQRSVTHTVEYFCVSNCSAFTVFTNKFHSYFKTCEVTKFTTLKGQ